MKLLTKAIRKQLPALYTTSEQEDPVAIVKFFDPCGQFTWFATEGGEIDGEYTFFGLVDGFEKEWGYFTLAELESYRGRFGLDIERDLYFSPTKLSEIRG